MYQNQVEPEPSKTIPKLSQINPKVISKQLQNCFKIASKCFQHTFNIIWTPFQTSFKVNCRQGFSSGPASGGNKKSGTSLINLETFRFLFRMPSNRGRASPLASHAPCPDQHRSCQPGEGTHAAHVEHDEYRAANDAPPQDSTNCMHHCGAWFVVNQV